MDSAENQLETIDKTKSASEAKILILEKVVIQLKDRTDQLENNFCRCNVRILGIEENKEGTRSGFQSTCIFQMAGSSWTVPTVLSLQHRRMVRGRVL